MFVRYIATFFLLIRDDEGAYHFQMSAVSNEEATTNQKEDQIRRIIRCDIRYSFRLKHRLSQNIVFCKFLLRCQHRVLNIWE